MSKHKGSGVASAVETINPPPGGAEGLETPNNATPGPRNRNRGIRTVRVVDLVEHELNYREHPAEQRDMLTATVREIGWYGYPDVYEQADGTLKLIDGHLRKSKLLEDYGADAEIEVNVTDMSDEDARKAILTHDPLASFATMNGATLDALIEQTEFDSASLRKMVDDLLASCEAVDTEAEYTGTNGQPGDVNVEDMELQPEEHYDFILVLADNVNDWNRLVALFNLPHVQLSRTHRRIGMARAVKASRVLELIDAT